MKLLFDQTFEEVVGGSVSPELRALARKVVEQKKHEKPMTPEEIDAWARRLAEQVSALDD